MAPAASSAPSTANRFRPAWPTSLGLRGPLVSARIAAGVPRILEAHGNQRDAVAEVFPQRRQLPAGRLVVRAEQVEHSLGPGRPDPAGGGKDPVAQPGPGGTAMGELVTVDDPVQRIAGGLRVLASVVAPLVVLPDDGDAQVFQFRVDRQVVGSGTGQEYPRGGTGASDGSLRTSAGQRRGKERPQAADRNHAGGDGRRQGVSAGYRRLRADA